MQNAMEILGKNYVAIKDIKRAIEIREIGADEVTQGGNVVKRALAEQERGVEDEAR